MTLAKLLLGTIVSQIIFVLIKITFIQYLNIESGFFIAVMWFLLAIASIAIVRRMGVLNYFESFFIAIVWTLGALFLDLVITTSVTGREVYREQYFWICYLVVILAVTIFHKKAHVQMRKMIKRQNK